MDGQAIKAVLGKNIRFFRSRKNLTQAVLAEKASISIIFLSSIERGTKYPQPGILGRIAKALEVEVFELFKGDLVPSDDKELLVQLSKDITAKVNSAMEDIFNQYIGP